MQKLVYVPPGESIDNPAACLIMEDAEPYILSSVSGPSDGENEIVTAKTAGTDGEWYLFSRRSAGSVKCSMWISGNSRAELYTNRMRLRCLLRATGQQTGTLYYYNDHITARIPAVPRSCRIDKRIRNYLAGELVSSCPEPYWTGLEERQADIACVEGSGFRLPTALDRIQFAHVLNTLDIDYQGTAPAPVQITVIGPSETPTITNDTTHCTIRMTRSLAADELLVINTERGRKSVKLISGDTITDAFGYLAPDSRFWELVPGDNHIVYGDGGQASTSVYIRWSDRYEGV